MSVAMLDDWSCLWEPQYIVCNQANTTVYEGACIEDKLTSDDMIDVKVSSISW